MDYRIETVSRQKRATIAAKWCVGLGIVGYLLATLDVKHVAQQLSRADLTFLAAGLLLTVVGRLLNARQVAIAIRHHGITLSTWRIFLINTAVGFYSLFLPGLVAAGAVKWYKLSRAQGKGAEVFAAILFLRVLNTTVILACGVAAILFENPFPSRFLFWAAAILGAGLLVMLLCLFMDRLGTRMEQLVRWWLPWLPASIVERFRKVATALSRYRTLPRSHTVRLVAIPIMCQALSAVVFLTAARALSLQIPLVALFWIIAMVYMIQFIPVSLAGLGIREGALVCLLPAYGIAPADALAFSLTVFSFTLFMGLVGGIIEGTGALFGRLPQPSGAGARGCDS